jgi:hypothetical protein
LARNRLEAEGIPAFLIDTSAAGVFSGMGIAVVKLYVPEAELSRARAILAAPGEDPLLRRMNAELPLPREDSLAWIYCPHCGSEVSVEFDDCPGCGTAVDVRPDPFSLGKAHVRMFPHPHKDGLGEAGPSPDSDLLDRAWRAAVFGLMILPGVFHAYSFWLLCRIAFSPGPAGAVAWNKFLGVLLIDLTVFFGIGLLIHSFMV